MRWWSGSLILVGAIVVGAGCSTDADRGTVEGMVTLDGRSLETGLIRFVPVDGGTATADAAISAGQFTANVPIGEKRVEITAPKVTGKQKAYDTPDSPTVDIVRELLPTRYNLNSELTLTIKPGHIEKKFELESD